MNVNQKFYVIQSLDLEEVITWCICTPFYFWSRSNNIFWREFGLDILLEQKCFYEPIESRDHYFWEISGWIQSKTTCICVTWLPPPNLGTGSKVAPPRRSFQGYEKNIPDFKPTFASKFGQMVHFMVWRVIMIEGNRTGVGSVGVLWVLFCTFSFLLNHEWNFRGALTEKVLERGVLNSRVLRQWETI